MVNSKGTRKKQTKINRVNFPGYVKRADVFLGKLLGLDPGGQVLGS